MALNSDCLYFWILPTIQYKNAPINAVTLIIPILLFVKSDLEQKKRSAVFLIFSLVIAANLIRNIRAIK